MRLFSTYGPTETTVVVTTQELQREDPSQAQLPIGLPLPGMQALILGRGATRRGGSWYCSARSWPTAAWGRARQFRYPPGWGAEQMPVYRTGDRVRLVDGRLVYLVGATTNSR